MIVLVLIRRAVCEVCLDWFDLSGTLLPEQCPYCGSKDWQYGPEAKDTRLIRMGITKKTKRLNPGTRYLKRREHGKKQWRQFKPKPPDEIDVAPDAQRGDN